MPYNDDAREPSSVTGQALALLPIGIGISAVGITAAIGSKKAINMIKSKKAVGDVADDIAKSANKGSEKIIDNGEGVIEDVTNLKTTPNGNANSNAEHAKNITQNTNTKGDTEIIQNQPTKDNSNVQQDFEIKETPTNKESTDTINDSQNTIKETEKITKNHTSKDVNVLSELDQQKEYFGDTIDTILHITNMYANLPELTLKSQNRIRKNVNDLFLGESRGKMSLQDIHKNIKHFDDKKMKEFVNSDVGIHLSDKIYHPFGHYKKFVESTFDKVENIYDSALKQQNKQQNKQQKNNK